MREQYEKETETSGLTDEELIMLDALLYYYNLSGGTYNTIGDFVDACMDNGYTSVINPVIADEESGMTKIVETISDDEKYKHLRELKIVYSSNDAKELSSTNAVCLMDDKANMISYN